MLFRSAVCVLEKSEQKFKFPVLVEIKTRVSGKAAERLREMDRVVMEFLCHSDEFKLVPAEYRQQLLHHSAIFDIERVLYIESTMGRIHHAFLISFSDSEKPIETPWSKP